MSGEQWWHHFHCFPIKAKSYIYSSFSLSPRFDNISLTHCTTQCLFQSHLLHAMNMNRGGVEKNIAGPSFMLTKRE